MNVEQLIEQLQKVEDKSQNVFVYTFTDVGGFSDVTTDIKIEINEDGIYLVEE